MAEFPLTKQQQHAFDLIESTNKNVLIQGPPGTGKSVVTRALQSDGDKTYTIGAPTGLAALNAGGKTIHSIFGIPSSDGIIEPDNDNYTRNERAVANIQYNVKHLVIDEVSMVRVDQFEFMERTLRHIKNRSEPWGGVQLILVGDFFQLPPVVKSEERDPMSRHWDSPFVFSSPAFSGCEVVNLTEVLRQKGDNKFIDILGRARVGDVTDKDLALLNKQVGHPTDIRIHLTGINRLADEMNQRKLAQLAGPSITYDADSFGDWPQFPVDTLITLKVGAQVIVKVNRADRPPQKTDKGPFESKVVNGTLGRVVELAEDKVIIETDFGPVPIYRQKWERKVKEKIDGKWMERTVATYEQMPLALAWAISMHKSQGQSFDKVHIDATKIFAPGQMYVALSRVRSIAGLSLEIPLKSSRFWADENVLEFFKSQSKQHAKQRNRNPKVPK